MTDGMNDDMYGFGAKNAKKKVVFCVPIVKRPYPGFIKALEESIPLIHAAGWDEELVQEINNPYISGARAKMLRKALDHNADVIVFLDYDLEWEPKALLELIETEGDVIAGTYRCKIETEQYMGAMYSNADGTPIVREDGCIKASVAPAGFLKITKEAVHNFMAAYPELCYGPKYHQSVDLFNHGAHEGLWWGEDYAFCRRYREKCGEVWIKPDINITHWMGETPYPGNQHTFLRRQPGGDLHAAPAGDVVSSPVVAPVGAAPLMEAA
jgi:glycosyltransferase involved in cell wall biosynthesis